MTQALVSSSAAPEDVRANRHLPQHARCVQHVSRYLTRRPPVHVTRSFLRAATPPAVPQDPQRRSLPPPAATELSAPGPLARPHTAHPDALLVRAASDSAPNSASRGKDTP